jgi:osmotically-inducible protein OsmY
MISFAHPDGGARFYPVAQAARERLRKVPYSGVHKVSCQCDGRGRLFLRGRLSSFFQKQLAQEAVLNLEGVAQVVNEIEVTWPA